ncbi:hypothetical protein BZG13_15045 [Salinivibrio sp. ML323]|uniref:hypothetical protein n=1 Tax=Salinivibrio sp. ML323 TaxID=1909474 RepID=UPI000985B5FC|nr:hypothetical protein [Salinivibrio sp. ML323]OOE55279.1 hypothetical protein BZG13_15045 [Salinivibrio sp. ML323]
MIHTALAGAIGVGDTSPGKVLDMCTLSTGACHDQCQYLIANVGWRAAEITPSLCDREGAYADLCIL